MVSIPTSNPRTLLRRIQELLDIRSLLFVRFTAITCVTEGGGNKNSVVKINTLILFNFYIIYYSNFILFDIYKYCLYYNFVFDVVLCFVIVFDAV